MAAETYDGFLNDINGHHVTVEHVAQALDAAASGPIEEGSVGGGTGMISLRLQGRLRHRLAHRSRWQGQRYTVGVFVQANFGKRRNFMIRGRRVGAELAEPAIVEGTPRAEKSSIIAIVATDAPFLPHQLKRLARRVPLGVAWTGGLRLQQLGRHLSRLLHRQSEAAAGAVRARWRRPTSFPTPTSTVLRRRRQATEEAILNSLTANEDMTGRDGNFVPALPKDWLARNYPPRG